MVVLCRNVIFAEWYADIILIDYGRRLSMKNVLDGYKVRASRFLIKDDLDKTFIECMDDICCEIRKKSKVITFSCVEGEMRLKA